MQRLLALALAAAVVGSLVGVVRSRSTEGSGGWAKFLFTPGAGVNLACLSCGWHDGACESTLGTALDFPGWCTDTETVYFRSFGFNNSDYAQMAAYGTAYASPYATCKTNYVNIYDTGSNILGTMWYTHTYLYPGGGGMAMLAIRGGTRNQKAFAGMTKAPGTPTVPEDQWENWECVNHKPDPWWTGVHLHEESADSASTFALRDGADCDDDDRYLCLSQSLPYPTYNPQDWRTDYTRDLCTNETDSDGDGMPDCRDNCPAIANPSQADADRDGIGNVCELDVLCDGDLDGADVIMLLRYIVGWTHANDQCPPTGNFIYGPRASAYVAYPGGGTIRDVLMILYCIVGYHNIVCPASGGGLAAPATASPVSSDGGGPTVAVQDGQVPAGGSEVTRLSALEVAQPPVCGVTVDVQYDPLVNVPLGCDADPEDNFDSKACNPNYPGNIVRVTAGTDSLEGLTGDIPLVDITWCALGGAGESSPLDVQIVDFVDCGDPPADITPVADQDGVNVVVSGPPPADSDGDAFGDCVEAYMGTDPTDACPDSSSDDAWPLDINMDTRCDVLDILQYPARGVLLTSCGDANYQARFDLNTDCHVNVLDLLTMVPYLMTSCTP